ncbi:MAG: SDR family NAD(P)-dependent oxidoreductase, partial [Actinomycetota bacterium]|nr:SDR family NAD(P)-dependent oxidoreductase [Actinomycetota bacterium]
GAEVALLARSRPGLEVAAQAARRYGGQAHVVPADVSDRPALEAAVEEAVARLGGLDVLVSNHAGMVFGNFADVAPEDFDRTIEVTLIGVANAIRAALPHLERSGGNIVVTGSIMATVPLPTFASYVAAKHGVRGLVASLRLELRRNRSPVSISMIHPGAIDTPLWRNLSSAGRYVPRRPPDLYSPEAIARALVAAAIRPRAEFTVGGSARVVQLGWSLLRPVAEQVLALVSRYYLSGRHPAPRVGLLRGPVGDGRASGGFHGRPSLWAWLRLGRPYRQGRR